MAGNKRMRKRAPQASPMLPFMDESEPKDVAALQRKAKQIQRNMHRLKVEMAADRMGFPVGRPRKMTFAQAAAKRRAFMVQAAEFMITAVLFVGACAWLYQWWLARQGP
ncbi:MAG: hypothetical protein ACAH88_08145 [Roseimicrobium sp.]